MLPQGSALPSLMLQELFSFSIPISPALTHRSLGCCPNLTIPGPSLSHPLLPRALGHPLLLLLQLTLFLKHSRLAPTPDLFTSCSCCPTKCSFPDIPMALSSPPSGFCSNFTFSVRQASKYSPWGLPGSPVVRLCTSTAGGMGSIPGQGTPTCQGATRKTDTEKFEKTAPLPLLTLCNSFPRFIFLAGLSLSAVLYQIVKSSPSVAPCTCSFWWELVGMEAVRPQTY